MIEGCGRMDLVIDNVCRCSIHWLSMVNIQLQSEDRELFNLIWQATFINPFGTQRETIFEKLGAPKGSIEVDEKIQARLQTALDRYQVKGQLKLVHFKGEDQSLIKHILLWQIYHHYVLPLDDFIAQQDAAGQDNLSAVFAKEVLAEMAKGGLTKSESLFYLAIFYQLRRAWFFIVHGLVGCSSPMRKLRMDLWNTIFTYDIAQYESFLYHRMEDFSTMLLGPTGSGKGACARAIGKSGFIPFDSKTGKFKVSFNQSFTSVNLSEYSETLVESELFGHAKGSFTGAVGSHDGVLSRCSKYGSIFIDEIGEVSLSVQIKLLKVLEERQFSPVGSHDTKRFAGRVIAATNQSLDQLRRDGLFRDDFYYRLCSDVIVMPSLKERFSESRKELEMMVAHCVKTIIGESNDTIVDQVLEVIDTQLGKDYPWPGNVRELAQCVRSVLLKRTYQDASNSTIEKSSSLASLLAAGDLTAQELTIQYCKSLYQQNNSYAEVAQITDLDWRTVKKHTSGEGIFGS